MATSSETTSDEEHQYSVLRSNEGKIANLINLTCLLPLLRTKGLLTDKEFKLLQEMSPENRINGGTRLVQILLSKKGGNVLDLFIEALREEGHSEHVGHKSLAFELLAELSKPKMMPPRSRASTLPEKFVRREINRQSLPKHMPISTRSFSESEASASISTMDHTSYGVANQESEQQCLDNAHHLKHMSKKLQRTIASQHSTMQTVCQLAKVIADMQDKMSTMQHLLSVLLDNNQKSSGIYTTIGQNGNYEIKRSPSCHGKNNEYVDSPISTHIDVDSVGSFTNKMDTGIHQILQMSQEEAVICIQLEYLLPELQKRKLVTDIEFHQLSDEWKLPDEKNRVLMHIIETKGGEKSFDLFVQALEAEQQHAKHNHLAKVLREAKAVLISQLITPPKLPPKPRKVLKVKASHVAN